jgi:hypothetical protein
MIRIPKAHWGKVWRVLVASAPISRCTSDLIYSVSERQVSLLRRKKLPFELVNQVNGLPAKKKNG